jgi:hypothetical protein
MALGLHRLAVQQAKERLAKMPKQELEARKGILQLVVKRMREEGVDWRSDRPGVDDPKLAVWEQYDLIVAQLLTFERPMVLNSGRILIARR